MHCIYIFSPYSFDRLMECSEFLFFPVVSTNVGLNSSFFTPSHQSQSTSLWKLRPKNFGCEICGKRFTLHREYIGHLNFVHLKIKPFQCPRCLRGFSHEIVLKRHKKLCN